MMAAQTQRIVEWHPIRPNVFACCHGQRLEQYNISCREKIELTDFREIALGAQITCMNWYPNCSYQSTNASNSEIIAAGTTSGSVSLVRVSQSSSISTATSPVATSNIRSSNDNGNLINHNSATPFGDIFYEPSGISGKRSCTSIQWNRHIRGLLAVGFEKSRSSSEQFCCAVWDMEHSVKSWGVKSESTPIFKPSIEEPTASLCWLSNNPLILAVGTSISCVRLYDLRVGMGSGQSTEALTLMAHSSTRPRKVRGIRPDPFNQHILATFSDSAGEPIKLWDLRKGTSAKPKLTILPHGINDVDHHLQQQYQQQHQQQQSLLHQQQQQQQQQQQFNAQCAVVDISWSNNRSGVLAVATTQQRAISFYNTNKPPSDVFVQYPIFSIPVADPIKSMSWQHSAIPSSMNRLLVATTTGFVDLDVVEGVALSIGPSGAIAIGSRNNLRISHRHSSMTTNFEVDSTADVSHFEKEDIDLLMKTRTTAGYAVDCGKNLQVIADETDRYSSSSNVLNDSNDEFRRTNLVELYRVWSWVERVESMTDVSTNLRDCGVLKLLQGSGENVANENTTVLSHAKTLNALYYTSPGRCMAKRVCGWSEKMWNDKNDAIPDGEDITYTDILDIVEDCELSDSFERAAALSLWHGHIELAVRILQRNIDHSYIEPPKYEEDDDDEERVPMGGYSRRRREREYDKSESHQDYVHLVSLVAMCIAGFAPTAQSVAGKDMWSSMCNRVLQQLETSNKPSTAYLIAVCRFLLENSTSSGQSLSSPPVEFKYKSLVDDSRLSFEDRVAFACTYLSTNDAIRWLAGLQEKCVKSGCLEGLIITGLTGAGLDILQHYLDSRQDIQSVALLVCRNVDDHFHKHSPSSQSQVQTDGANVSREWYWLQEYRNLLNRWQKFIDRAALDVELGKRYRLRSPSYNLKFSNISSVTTNIDRKSSAARVLYSLPPHCDMPHVFLRCHFCSSSLPVDAMQQQQSAAFLRKQKPILHCCPTCKKPLVRCYVCQLYMGLVNPHAEFNRALAQKRKVTMTTGCVSSSMTLPTPASSLGIYDTEGDMKHNVLDFGKWFSFCFYCKHGGHASCIDDWFYGDKSDGTLLRTVCGVNGCGCRCHHR